MLLTKVQLKGSRERGAPLVKHSSRDSDSINSICAFAPHVHFSTTRGFVLRDLRQHDLIAINLGNIGVGGWRNLGELEGSSQTITMGT